MTTTRAEEASSSMSRCSYHVFLSYRIKDGCSFVDRLYAALLHSGIFTFKSSSSREGGRTISSEMKRAVTESRISVIIFTKEYAFSRWCLDELVYILERKKSSGHMILPVFFNVEPSIVRKQTGSYAEALLRHEKKIMEESGERVKESTAKVQRWRATLKEMADLSGLVSDDGNDQFIQAIVEDTWNKLSHTVLNVARHPVGLYPRAKDISFWLQDGSDSCPIMVIYGEAGVGKTTISRCLYNLDHQRFERSSFLSNIRETARKSNGLVILQRKILSDILETKGEVYNTSEGFSKIKEALLHKRFLLVLDDVDQVEQVNALLGMRDWFRVGSKVIITSRNKKLLNPHEACLFEAKKLDENDSFRLFSRHAFGQDHPIIEHKEHSRKLVCHCQGIPLALQVLAASLSGGSADLWESTIDKLEQIHGSPILQILESSYESLQDDHERNLFLDIACFFVGKDKDYTVKILDECGFYTTAGIENLTDRCLITVSQENKLVMHQLLQEIAKDVVCRESPELPGKRSRVWNCKDALTVLTAETGGELIEGIILNLDVSEETKYELSKYKVDEKATWISKDDPQKMHVNSASTELSLLSDGRVLNTKSFSRMEGLRLLQLHNVQLSGEYRAFPKKLRWLCWHGFQLNSIPSDLPLENLVVLEMCNSNLQQVWEGKKCLKSLKILDLSYSHCLTKTPDFSELPRLERVILEDCISLVEIHESIGCLYNLEVLNLRGCASLREIPRKFKAISLENLILSGCSKLELPLTVVMKEPAKGLSTERTAYNRIYHLTSVWKYWGFILVKLVCSILKSWLPLNASLIPASPMSGLQCTLKSLDLSDCNMIEKSIHAYICKLYPLQYLNLSRNPISMLPESIGGLTMLQSLTIAGCTRLQSVPELPSSLNLLDARGCTSLERISNLPKLLTLLELQLEDCVKLVEVGGLFKLECVEKINKMLGVWGLGDSKQIQRGDVELYNYVTSTRSKGPPQGVHEFGIFSIFLPGSEIPDKFHKNSTGSPISFVVSSRPDSNVCGLLLIITYGLPNKEGLAGERSYIKISNKTKEAKWIYSPIVFAVKGPDETLSWLSHWKFSNQLEIGDHITVSLSMRCNVKEFGVHVLCNRDEERVGFENDAGGCTSSPHFQHAIDGDFSSYQINPGVYLLCNHS